MTNNADKGVDFLEGFIRDGEKAVADFYELSGGAWFDEAPEYFLTTYLASSIQKLNKSYALLEVNVGETRKEAKAYRRGRPANNERRNGRYDFVIYWANGNPRGAIEVKSPLWIVDENKLSPDFDRLCTTISANSDSTFQFGAFVYYASVSDPKVKHDNASAKLRELINSIHTRAKNSAKEHDLSALSWPGSIHRGKEDESGAWCIAAIVFSRKGGERSFQK